MMEIIGLPLSLVAIAAFVALVLDWRRRRGRFEPVHVGDSRLGAGAAQWVWLALLVGSFAVAMWGPAVPLTTHERQVFEPQPGQSSEPPAPVRTAQRFRVSVTLPFYRLGRTTERDDGVLRSVTVTRQLVAPVWFVVVAVLYWLFVVRRSQPATAAAAGRAASRS